MKVLNAYAGIGGNRHLWPEEWDITAIENHPLIAKEYSQRYPKDRVILTDAHEYIRTHFREFDFIWSSPPCPTHSALAKASRHPNKKYPDMTLYEEILFLQHFFKGRWVVENVKPYYNPLIRQSTEMGRHYYWHSKALNPFDRLSQHNIGLPPFGNVIAGGNTEGAHNLCDWLGIPRLEKNIYFPGNHDPSKIVRNCVHPKEGLVGAMGVLRTKPEEPILGVLP